MSNTIAEKKEARIDYFGGYGKCERGHRIDCASKSLITSGSIPAACGVMQIANLRELNLVLIPRGLPRGSTLPVSQGGHAVAVQLQNTEGRHQIGSL